MVLPGVGCSAIAEQSNRSCLAVTGPDARTWLNGLVTVDVKSIPPGSARYALLLNKQGKIQTDLFVLAESADLLLAVPSAILPELQQTLGSYLVMEDAELEDWSQQGNWFFGGGPGILSFLTEIAECHPGVVWGEVPRLGSEMGVVWAPRTHLEALQSWLQKRFSASALGIEAWNEYRLAHSIPQFSVDFTHKDNPHEAALERCAVDWDKGCYLGQEVVCMQEMRGKIKRRLVCLELRDSPEVAEGAPLWVPNHGEPVGQVTSAYSQQNGRVWVFARVQGPFLEAPRFYIAGRPAERR